MEGQPASLSAHTHRAVSLLGSDLSLPAVGRGVCAGFRVPGGRALLLAVCAYRVWGVIGSTLHALPLELIARVGRCVRTQPSPHPTPGLLFSSPEQAGPSTHALCCTLITRCVRQVDWRVAVRSLVEQARRAGEGVPPEA